jgi:predicted ATP-grasp superfamily ATP-dependent carboligase
MIQQKVDISNNDMTNVLIFPSGTGVSKEIFDALKYIRNINIVGVDADDCNFSAYQFASLETGAPFIKNKDETISFLQNIIKKYNITSIYPAFDSIIVFLKTWEKELGVRVISSPLETCNICFSKKLTYDYFRRDIRVPELFDINSDIKFPVFIKPECGYGARDSFKITNRRDLEHLMCSTIEIFVFLRVLVWQG